MVLINTVDESDGPLVEALGDETVAFAGISMQREGNVSFTNKQRSECT